MRFAREPSRPRPAAAARPARDRRASPCPLRWCSFGPTTANQAPCGSWATAMKAPPGTSIGPCASLPPAAVIRAIAGVDAVDAEVGQPGRHRRVAEAHHAADVGAVVGEELVGAHRAHLHRLRPSASRRGRSRSRSRPRGRWSSARSSCRGRPSAGRRRRRRLPAPASARAARMPKPAPCGSASTAKRPVFGDVGRLACRRGRRRPVTSAAALSASSTAK